MASLLTTSLYLLRFKLCFYFVFGPVWCFVSVQSTLLVQDNILSFLLSYCILKVAWIKSFWCVTILYQRLEPNLDILYYIYIVHGHGHTLFLSPWQEEFCIKMQGETFNIQSLYIWNFSLQIDKLNL